jgi:hypothetical protein
VLAVLALLGSVVIAVGARHDRLRSALAACLLALGMLWLAMLAAVRTDWRDADGFIDCWPSCTLYQDATGVVLIGSPVVVLAWLGAAALFVWRRRKRNVRPPLT